MLPARLLLLRARRTGIGGSSRGQAASERWAEDPATVEHHRARLGRRGVQLSTVRLTASVCQSVGVRIENDFAPAVARFVLGHSEKTRGEPPQPPTSKRQTQRPTLPLLSFVSSSTSSFVASSLFPLPLTRSFPSHPVPPLRECLLSPLSSCVCAGVSRSWRKSGPPTAPFSQQLTTTRAPRPATANHPR